MKALTLILSLIFLTAINLQAEQKKKAEKKVPVQITADKMKYDDTKAFIYFTGNVVIDDGAMKLTCDIMTVTLDENKEAKIIDCEKNVVIRKERTTSTSDRAKYLIAEQKITLTGNPIVTQINENGEKQKMTGRKITLYRNTNVIESEGIGMSLPASSSQDLSKKDSKKKEKPATKEETK
ncbi:MAG: LPS export ABC transporter periplasmic protein LptC [Lentisphaeraceae bacterium]|nr:LPS export ABC transporter periplasmic protein LptC [Lentisphaeraceae bacterium]